MNETPIKLLLVEDDEDDYIIVLEQLCRVRETKFDLTWVCTYPEAIVEINKKRHDVYVFDLRLGLDSGIDLIQDARARGSDTPIIMLTRYSDRSLEKKARDVGADDFLLKIHTTAETLEKAILGALSKRRPPAEPPADTKPPAAP